MGVVNRQQAISRALSMGLIGAPRNFPSYVHREEV
jgi:hypothetical protein